MNDFLQRNTVQHPFLCIQYPSDEYPNPYVVRATRHPTASEYGCSLDVECDEIPGTCVSLEDAEKNFVQKCLSLEIHKVKTAVDIVGLSVDISRTSFRGIGYVFILNSRQKNITLDLLRKRTPLVGATISYRNDIPDGIAVMLTKSNICHNDGPVVFYTLDGVIGSYHDFEDRYGFAKAPGAVKWYDYIRVLDVGSITLV